MINNNKLNELVNLGFMEVGYWCYLSNGDLCYGLDDEYRRRIGVLYSFILENGLNEVLYIGKTSYSLDRRMFSYCTKNVTRGTNEFVQTHIKQLLNNKIVVKIYAKVEFESIEYKGFTLDIYHSLEAALIKALQPPWNTSMKS